MLRAFGLTGDLVAQLRHCCDVHSSVAHLMTTHSRDATGVTSMSGFNAATQTLLNSTSLLPAFFACRFSARIDVSCEVLNVYALGAFLRPLHAKQRQRDIAGTDFSEQLFRG